jgi:Anti-sigma-K factor rskA
VTDKPPVFEDFVDPDDPERERLREAHEMLLAAGPPPELSPAIAAAPGEPKARIIQLPRRRRSTALAALAAAAVILFGVGYAVGKGERPPGPVREVAMSGPGGTAVLKLQQVDGEGNWPMELIVDTLPSLPKGQTYSLWLTRKGKLAEPCGTFAGGPETGGIWLNAPYKLRSFDGWVVVRTGSKAPYLLQTAQV